MSKSYDHLKTITPVFRASWVNLFEKDKHGNYSLTMLFDPDDDLKGKPDNKYVNTKTKTNPEGYTKSLKAIVALAVKEKWGDNPPKRLKLPFHEQADEDYEGYGDKGLFAPARSPKRKPYVVDVNMQPLTSEEFYSGCYAQAIVHAYPWVHEDGGKGVTLTLHGVIKVADGERLAGGTNNPENDFEAMEDVDDVSDTDGADDLDIDALVG